MVNAVLDVLAELPAASDPVKEPVAAEAQAVATAFLVRLFGDSYLEGLRLRETVARFIVVSDLAWCCLGCGLLISV